MTLYFLIIFGIYFVLVLAFLVGWFIAIQSDTKNLVEGRFITVIVPFRNEEKCILDLLNSISKQTYPANFFEVICIDDDSTDASKSKVELFCQQHSNFKCIQLGDGMVGKKKAITLGILQSKGELIVTTDADCTVSPQWLEKINAKFSNQTQLLIGAVKIESKGTFFSKLQATEFASLIGSGFATAAYQLPTMANGANLAFRKQAFDEVNGYAGSFEIASGDDEHLMRKIKMAFPNSIQILAEPEAIVSTQPQPSLNDFVQQRVRWAGKWKFNQSVFTRLLAVFILLFQVSWLALIFLFALGKAYSQTNMVLILTKIFLEFLFLYAVQLFLKMKWQWMPFFALQLLYPMYVVFVAVRSNFLHPNWKDRTV